VEQRDQLRNKVIGSMIYPVFLLVAGTTIVMVLVTYFMPKLEPLFEGMELPALTRVVMTFGNVVGTYFWLILLAVLLTATAVLPYFRSEAGRRWWDRVQLKLPGAGSILRMVAICRFCRVLGTLLANGVPMLAALNVSRESAGNSVLSDVIAEAAEAVRAGKGLAQTLRESGLFPPDIVETLAVAEETNRLSAVLVELAERHEERISRRVDTAVRLL
jgi:general secretion pathway protein F/type IV pilus assembly protein PilC